MKVPIRGACQGNGQLSGLSDRPQRSKGSCSSCSVARDPWVKLPPRQGPGDPATPKAAHGPALNRQGLGEAAVSLPCPSPALASFCPHHCSRPPHAPGCPAAGWCSWPARSTGTRPWGWCPSPPAESRAPSRKDSPSGHPPAPGPGDLTRCQPTAHPAGHDCGSRGTPARGSGMSQCPGHGSGCCGMAAQLGSLPRDPPCPAAHMPYLEEGHVLAVVLLALLQVRAVDEGAALLGIAITYKDTAGSARQLRPRACSPRTPPAPTGGLPGPRAPRSHPIPARATAAAASQPPASPLAPRTGRGCPSLGAMHCPAQRADPPERVHAAR